jgi:hypothetical protein
LNAGFAVTSNAAQFVLSEILQHGRVRRACIGVAAQTVAVKVGVLRRGQLRTFEVKPTERRRG